jgi:hypothetical protein
LLGELEYLLGELEYLLGDKEYGNPDLSTKIIL